MQTGALLELDGEPISSTRIRAAVASGDLDARRCLAGSQALGEVVHGDARGRTMGFPTANVAPQAGALPPAGVYAVEAVVDGDTFAAVANLGAGRPSTTAKRAWCTCSTSTATSTAGTRGHVPPTAAGTALLRRTRDLKRQIAIDVTAARTCLKA